MEEIIDHWLISRKEQFFLLEGEEEIILLRRGQALLISVQLTPPHTDALHLQTWMRLGLASLNHYQGALALRPEDSALWLIQCLPEGYSQQPLLDCLEALLNQRDTWRAIFARLSRRPQSLRPSSLSSALY